MAQFTTHSPEETCQLGERLGHCLHAGDIIAFTGGLGAGKTTLCRGIALGLGCVDPASSPTYAIVNLYRGAQPFAHFDLYRLQTEDDLETAGFYEYLDSGAVLALEWSENLPLPVTPNIRIDIQTIDETTRQVNIEGVNLL